MKKLFIIPVLLICMTSASSNKIQPEPITKWPYQPALNTKIDSLGVKTAELERLLKQIP
jgi:hypothetical protein